MGVEQAYPKKCTGENLPIYGWKSPSDRDNFLLGTKQSESSDFTQK